MPYYEVVPSSSSLFNTLHHVRKMGRSKRSVSEFSSHSDDPVVIEFKAFGEDFRLLLRPSKKLLSPSFHLLNEALPPSTSSNDTSDQAAVSSLEHCFFQGTSEAHPHSAVALSLCNGMVRNAVR